MTETRARFYSLVDGRLRSLASMSLVAVVFCLAGQGILARGVPIPPRAIFQFLFAGARWPGGSARRPCAPLGVAAACAGFGAGYGT